MTANEMRYEFNVGYDKIVNQAAPGYRDAEVSVLLNKAQEEFIITKYQPLGNKYRQGYEQSEKRRKDLSNLTETAVLDTYTYSATDNHPNGRFWLLPDNLLYTIQEETLINIDNECDEVDYTETLSKVTRATTISIADGVAETLMRIPVKPITHDEYNYTIKSPFKKPSRKKVLRLDYNRDNLQLMRTHELLTDGTYVVVRYFVRYIRRPRGIVVDKTTPANMVNCELDESTHREVVAIAVRMATGITKPEEYQIKTIEEAKTE